MNKALANDSNEFWRRAEPFLLSDDELRRQFGKVIETLREAMSERFVERPVSQRADIAIWFAEKLRRFEAVVAAGVELLRPPTWSPALAGTRGSAAAQDAPAPGPLSLSFEKSGQDCRLSATVEQGERSIAVQIVLLTADGKALRPFTLSVQDDENGRWYVKEKTFERGRALLRDVQPGRYRLCARADQRSCDLVMEIQSSTG